MIIKPFYTCLKYKRKGGFGIKIEIKEFFFVFLELKKYCIPNKIQMFKMNIT